MPHKKLPRMSFFIRLLKGKSNCNKQNRSTEGCSKLKRSVDMTSSGKNGLNIRTNASPKWDRTRCPEGKININLVHWLVGWLVVLRIYVASAIFQPYRDLKAGDNQSLKS